MCMASHTLTYLLKVLPVKLIVASILEFLIQLWYLITSNKFSQAISNFRKNSNNNNNNKIITIIGDLINV